MDPTLLYALFALGGFLVSHFNVLPFLPKPSPTVPTPPTSVGHGELLKYIEQLIVNALAKAQPTPQPSSDELTALLKQLIDALQKQGVH